MGKLRQMSVGKQVALLFGLICAILVALGALLFFSLRSIERDTQLQQSRALKKLALIDDTAQDVGEMQAEVLHEVLASEVGEIRSLDQSVRETEETNDSELINYQKFTDTEKETQLYNKVMQARKIYWERTQLVLTFARANRDAEAQAFINSMQAPAYHAYLNAINALIAEAEAKANETAAATTHFISRVRIIGDTLAGLALFIAIFTGFAIVGVTRRLNDDNISLQSEVAERKRAEETLHESEEKFRQLAENITDVFWVTSPELQKMLYVSPAYELIWGRPTESLYADPHQWIEAILPEERDRIFAIFATLMRNQPAVSVEYRISRPDGTVRWIHDRGFQVRNAAGDVIRLTGIASDITERKLAEEQLERLRNEHKTILNSVSEGMHWIGGDGQIKFENPAAAKMLGYEADELIGKPGHLTIHHSRADGTPYPAEECPICATMKDGQVRHVKDEVFWRKDGTGFPVEYTSTPIRDENGELAGTVVVFTDVTERKSIEVRMMQSQKMETVGKLAGGVAHEFNSILTAIIGQSESLLDELPPEGPLGKSAREIRQAAERAATLTRQLLAYGRKQILQPETLDLNRLLTDMTGTLQHLMGNEINLQINPSVELKAVKIDPGQMEQVIVNIAMNAADAMPNGGRFTLETANVTLDEEYVRPFPGLKPGGYVMLAMTDTGIGMSEEVKARAFEPFFSTKGVGQGTGLGLATCYGILKQSNGHINVYSEVARGTTFKIYLPQVEPQAKIPPSRSTAPELPHGTETILLAEDDPALLEMSSTLLRRLGYTVFTAVNGVEALGLKQQRDIGHIDLLLTDVVMPHMSGKELSDRIRAIYPRTKILFTSAYTENAIVHQGILNEGVTLLQKPFTPSALANKVREVLDQ